MKQGVRDIYLSLRTHGNAAVDLGAESGGRLRRPPRPAGLVGPLGGRPGGMLHGAIPSYQEHIRMSQPEKTPKKSQGKQPHA
jgi:hypothetical protein